MLWLKNHISYSRCYIANPKGQNVQNWVASLQSTIESDPAVNESRIASTCLSGFESPFYRSMVNIFHLGGSYASMIASTKGWNWWAMIKAWSSGSWRDIFTIVVGLPFSRVPMVGIPNKGDACLCGGIPWLVAGALLVFASIDGGWKRIFPSPHGGHQMFLSGLAKSSHDGVPLWAPPWAMVGRTCENTLTFKLYYVGWNENTLPKLWWSPSIEVRLNYEISIPFLR